jgi:hypothetical protein
MDAMINRLAKVLVDRAEIELIRHEEADPPEDFFAQNTEEEDRKSCVDIRDRLECSEWAWFCAEVKVSIEGISESDFLGACSYSSEEDFRACPYFRDMVEEACLMLATRIVQIADLRDSLLS